MNCIQMNESLDELKDQNKRLENELNFANKCLNVLTKIRLNLKQILNLKTKENQLILSEEVIQIFQGLNEEFEVLTEKQVKSEITEENEELFVSQNTDSLNSLIRSTKQSLNIKSNELSEKQSILSDHNYGNLIEVVAQQQPKARPVVSHPIIKDQNIGTDVRPQLTMPSINKIIVLRPNRSAVVFTNPTLKLPNSRLNKSIISKQIRIEKDQVENVNLPRTKLQIMNERPIVTQPINDQKLNIPNDRNVFFRCIADKCNKQCETLAQIRCHQKESHGMDDSIDDKQYFQTKDVRCDDPKCNRYFRDKRQMRRHLSVHTKERNFKCDFADCGKTFKANKYLLVHKVVHTEGPTIKCEFDGCDYTTKIKRYLKLHQDNFHSSFKPFVCEYCAASFKYRAALQLHFKNRHSNDSPVVCPVNGCGKQMRSHYLKSHLLLHSNETLFCDWEGCRYRCKQTYSMAKHKRLIHTSELNYLCVCPECGKRFKRNKTLLNHMKIHSNDKPFVCEWTGCQYRTRFTHHLKVHKRIHNNEKPYACEWPGCDYRCAVSGNLRKHLKVHGKE